MHEFLLSVGGSLPASIVTKATVIAALGLIGARLARRQRAAVRHVLLAATFGALLLLPVASIVVPPVRIALKVVRQGRATLPPAEGSINFTPPLMPPDTHPAAAPASLPSSRPSLPELIFIGWLVGVALALIPMLVGLWEIRRLRRSGLPWAAGQATLDRLALETGIRLRVDVLRHEALPGPLASGMLHPAILLPPDAETWAKDDLNRALVHELEHVRRGDVMIHFLARAMCAAYWFHPLVWMAWRRLVLEAERACDDAVIARSEATAYADQLVALARKLLASEKSPLLAMASRSDLAIRVNAVLDGRQARGPVGRFAVALGCAVAAALTFTISPLRMVSVAQSAPSQSKTGGGPASVGLGARLPSFEVVSIKPSRPGEKRFTNFNSSRFTVEGETVKWLIAFAYSAFQAVAQLPDEQLLQVPAWITTETYDIDAKVEDALAEKLRGRSMGEVGAQIRLMTQSLLADRFGLKVHHQTKERPVYALVVTRGGPKFLQSRFTPAPGAANPVGPGGKPLPPASLGMRRYWLHGPVKNLAGLLSALPVIGRQVVDQTGIEGSYDFVLEVAQDQLQSAVSKGPGGSNAPPDSALPPESSEPSIFTAIQEQLGLKLRSSKGPVDVIVIDHIERPSAN